MICEHLLLHGLVGRVCHRLHEDWSYEEDLIAPGEITYQEGWPGTPEVGEKVATVVLSLHLEHIQFTRR